MKVLAALGILAIFFASVWGWILNIVALVAMTHETSPNLLLAFLRLAGIPLAALGVILGYVV